MTPPWLSALRGILQDGDLRVIEVDDPIYAPHRPPFVHAIPRTKEILIEVVRVAHQERIPLVPVGGNTAPRTAPVASAPFCLVSTELLDNVIEHAHEDLTLTVGPGISLANAQQVVGARGQQIPVRSRNPRRGTLGGLVARAEIGSSFAAYGQLRDQVLGIEVVHGDGRVARTGGRVVKNVTGYDLGRLYCGARGTLGIITELTFRLRGIERAGCTLAFSYGDPVSAWDAAFLLRDEVAGIFSLHLVTPANPEPWGVPGETAVIVGIRGEEELVEALGEACFSRPRGERRRQILGRDAVPLVDTLAPEGAAHFVAVVLPGNGRQLLEILKPLATGEHTLVADVLTGSVHLGLPQGWPLDEARERELGEALAPLDAVVDLPSDPSFHLRRFEHFRSSMPGGLEIMRALRRTLDPAGILNPGRTEISA